MSDVFYVWGGRFETTAKAWATPPSAKDILDGFETYGPFTTEAVADQTWLGVTRKNVDICSHRMLVTKLDTAEAPLFLARLLADYVQGHGARTATRFWRGVLESSALAVTAEKDVASHQGDCFLPVPPRNKASKQRQDTEFFS